jgi:single-stranded-DNA-specific exonuclease
MDQRSGGHEMAAGLKVKADRFEEFRAAFLDHAKKTLAPESLVPRLTIESEAELRHITAALANDMQRLGPFGQGNRRPILCLRDVELAGPPKSFGKESQHVQLYLRQHGTHMRAIVWRSAELLDQLKPGARIDLAVEPCVNEWNGARYVDLEVKDLMLA